MKREKGQLSIGLAFAFTAILAVFALLFNSSLLVREKMKLQQTTDLSALVGADVQRRNLNEIRNINDMIDTAYDIAFIAANLPHCLEVMGPCSLKRECITGFINGVLQTTSVTCQDACDKWDSFVSDQIIQRYEDVRNQLATEALTIIEKANLTAHDKAVDTFLLERNLPHGVKRVLARHLGGNLTLPSVRAAYEGGALSDTLAINDTKDLPLFIPANEARLFPLLTYGYPDTGAPPTQFCSFLGPVGVNAKLSTAKVVRTTNYTTAFLVSANYTPPNTVVDEKLAYLIKHPDPSILASQASLTDASGNPIRLFKTTNTSTGETKTDMTTMALAKPYGGTFPFAPAIPRIPFLNNNTGDEFTGAKLIGIANRAELNNFSLVPPIQLGTRETLYAEDYLH